MAPLDPFVSMLKHFVSRKQNIMWRAAAAAATTSRTALGMVTRRRATCASRFFSTKGPEHQKQDDVTMAQKQKEEEPPTSSTKDDEIDLMKKDDDHMNDISALSSSFGDTSYYHPTDFPDFTAWTNEDLQDNTTIAGWDKVASKPGKWPRGSLVGHVVSTKMQKTINVAVDRYRVHPKYGKRMKYTRKFMAHDDLEVAKDGDVVLIQPCQRISKHKHFLLTEIIRPKGHL